MVAASPSELVITRVMSAPVSAVFDAFTDPRHLANWWGPHGFRTTTQEIDVRSGGHWRYVMHGPDGRDYRNHAVFLEIDRPARLIMRHIPEPGTEPVTHDISLTLEAQGAKTLLTMRMVFPSNQNLDWAIKTYGVDEGLTQTIDRLDQYAGTLPQLRKVRDFDAPRDLVFRAWTDPKMVAIWWGPRGVTNPVCEMDVRVKGKIRIIMVTPDGEQLPIDGEFLEIDPPRRLVMLTKGTNTTCGMRFEIRQTITFEALGERKTRLTLESHILSAEEVTLADLTGMEDGWTGCLERLAEVLR